MKKIYLFLFIASILATASKAQMLTSTLIGMEDSMNDAYGILNIRNAVWYKYKDINVIYPASPNSPMGYNNYFTTDIKYDTGYAKFDDFIAPAVQDSSKGIIERGPLHNIIRLLEFKWDPAGIQWLPFSKDSFAYNNSILISRYAYKYATSTGTYTLDSQINYTYNTNGRLLSAVIANNKRIDFSYNSNNDLVQETDSVWQNSSWVPKAKTDYAYSSGNLISMSSYVWYATTTTWSLSEEHTYKYNSSNAIIVATSKEWTNGYLNSSSKDSNIYYGNNIQYRYHSGGPVVIRDSIKFDANNNIVLVYTQYVDAASGLLKNYSMITTAYNTFGQPELKKSYDWDDNLGIWKNNTGYFSTRFYYKQNTSDVKHTISNTNFSIYPSPAQNLLGLRISAIAEHDCILSITNMQGSVTRQWKEHINSGNSEKLFPVSDLPAGTYILNLYSGNGKMSKVFSIIK